MGGFVEKFFYRVLPDGPGWVPIITKDPTGALKETQWFSWPDEANDLLVYVKDHKSEDVYFSPMLYSKPSSRKQRRHAAKANVISARCVYADGDEAPPSVYITQPTINVETSPGRWHNYWVLTDTTDPLLIEQLSHSVSSEHKDDGVDNGWALSKRLRVPGTINTKNGGTHRVSFDDSGPEYTVGEFAADYPPVETVAADVSELPTDLPSAWDVLASLPGDPELLSLFQETPTSDYSYSLLKLELLLFEYDKGVVETFAVCREAACNKFKRPGRTEHELWKHVNTEYAKYKENQAKSTSEREQVAPIEPSKPEITPQPEDAWVNLNFLDEQERDMLPVTFVDRYTEWCMQQSSISARQYQESLAFMIMATVFSEYGYVHPAYGVVNLNLYMLILGDTTRSGKSTAKNFMERVLNGVSTGEWEYILPQDVTPEALTEVLSERPDKSSLLWRDEVQYVFDVARGNNSYLRGFKSVLTDTYDGYINGVARRTGSVKRTRRTRTWLNYVGIGISDKMTEVLQDEDFESGLLPRFIWAIDKGVKYDLGSLDVSQYTETRNKSIDEQYERIIADITQARQFWFQNKMRTGDRARISFTDEAWERWQAFTVEIESAARDHPTRARVLDPSARRMTVTTLKLAALLAMMDMQQTAELRHVLSAIHYATMFMKFTEYAAQKVSATHLSKDIDELQEIIISAGGSLSYKNALKHFKGRKTLREFNDVFSWMEQAGMLHKMTRGKTLYLEVDL